MNVEPEQREKLLARSMTRAATLRERELYEDQTWENLLARIVWLEHRLVETAEERDASDEESVRSDQRASEAEIQLVEAENDRDEAEEKIDRLEQEWRYARGMKLPTAEALANALADARGLSPQHISRLV